MQSIKALALIALGGIVQANPTSIVWIIDCNPDPSIGCDASSTTSLSSIGSPSSDPTSSASLSSSSSFSSTSSSTPTFSSQSTLSSAVSPSSSSFELSPTVVTPSPSFIPITSSSAASAPSSSSVIIPSCDPTHPATSVPDRDEWEYLGCFKDDPKNSILYGTITTFRDLSPAKCRDYCTGYDFRDLKYAYYGLKNGDQCWCSHTLRRESSLVAATTTCDAPCSGNNDPKCNGDACGSFTGNIDVYYNAEIDAKAPKIKEESYNYVYIGCYFDEQEHKLLDADTYFDNQGFVPDDCVAHCRVGGTIEKMYYNYAGVKGGNTCYCGETLRDDEEVSPRQVDNRECDAICTDETEPRQFCGGVGRLQVYEVSD